MKRVLVVVLLIVVNLAAHAQKMIINKKVGKADTILVSDILNITFNNPNKMDYFFNTNLWIGNKWSRNVNGGSWFPSINTLPNVAHFGIDDFSVGQVRTISEIPGGKYLEFDLSISLNSGGTNGDGAFFLFGDGWQNYAGTVSGISFMANGDIYSYEGIQGSQANKVKIGTFTHGQRFTMKMKRDPDGTIYIYGPNFEFSYIPAVTLVSNKFIVCVSNVVFPAGVDIYSVKMF